MDVSVVIPTCNRRDSLFSVLGDLARSTLRPLEVLIVDSSDRKLGPEELAAFPGLPIRYIESERSVCIQRNLGIRTARASWVLLCDDDLELPPDYLEKLVAHARAHPEAGAISGLFMEREGSGWQGAYPVTSPLGLVWRYLFQLSIWGEIHVDAPLVKPIAERYRRRGNHISSAGWPVIVDFSGTFFRTPIYSLGSSLVRKDWLLASPYDESLDPFGIGDNYGVALGFPSEGIHVVTDTYARNHREQNNRISDAEAFSRRLLVLDYYITSRKELVGHVSRGVFMWSLMGQVVFHTLAGDRRLARAAASTLLTIARGKNPYLRDAAAG